LLRTRRHPLNRIKLRKTARSRGAMIRPRITKKVSNFNAASLSCIVKGSRTGNFRFGFIQNVNHSLYG
jgi:hypothetical protein